MRAWARRQITWSWPPPGVRGGGPSPATGLLLLKTAGCLPRLTSTLPSIGTVAFDAFLLLGAALSSVERKSTIPLEISLKAAEMINSPCSTLYMILRSRVSPSTCLTTFEVTASRSLVRLSCIKLRQFSSNPSLMFLNRSCKATGSCSNCSFGSKAAFTARHNSWPRAISTFTSKWFTAYCNEADAAVSKQFPATDNENVTQALVENHLGGDARIRTTEHGDRGELPRDQSPALENALLGPVRAIRPEASVALLQLRQNFMR
mmetsp:Transcript_69989/g.177646  ORF Transcript_69989/g.177646 Transcript_69989/m.177646 type:complete len:262 (+) Transcript_69989:458-1243(+)